MPEQRPAPVTIDMTPEGDFRRPARAAPLPGGIAFKLGLTAAAIAAIAGAVAVAALFLWIASVMIPVALVAGLVAYVALRFQGGRGGSLTRR